MLIGIYYNWINPLKAMSHERSYCLTAEAKMQGCELVFFKRSDVDYIKRTVTGFIREDGEWTKKTFSLPDVLIDQFRVLPKEINQGIPEAKFLAHEVPRLKFGIYDKVDMYDKFKESKKIAQYIPDYDIIKYGNEIKKYIEKYDRIVLKPRNSSLGKGIAYLEKNDDIYLVKQNNNIYEFNEEQFANFIKMIIDLPESYFVQPYLECRTKLGYPFDFRLLVQRNGSGEWNIAKIYPRFGSKKTIVCNVSSGGMTTNIDYFLVSEYGNDKAKVIKEVLSELALDITKYTDGLFSYTLDELGIDLSIDKNEKIWLYEVNAAPLNTCYEWDGARNQIAYAKYFAEQSNKSKLPKKLWQMSNKVKQGLNFLLQDFEKNKKEFDYKLYFKINKAFSSIEEQLKSRYIYLKDDDFEELTNLLKKELFKLKEVNNQSYEKLLFINEVYQKWQQSFKDKLFQFE
ncbi:YheC/YheD family protein [Fuchsiella alkaliacetigena]|uniref:YheC/YheD family protein n=1 Tax=Fuchsiella alkaliacetigena TaxID=957042 RepID=UPI00200ABE86|nr:YheC/YheD family protein [Fuchsiella alkaliacetigena]MCK8824180.1 YheC/YheD family protein [Fuchsiella alkaliacetigena]